MEYKFLKYSLEGGIATVTLNRPEVYNALNDEITFELQDALKIVSREDQVRVIVLTGVGIAFCCGQDLKASSTQKDRSFFD
jgi:2-(1,2-epoxy-1,2-dihydrophenyl)acetyl-CoA isomerase